MGWAFASSRSGVDSYRKAAPRPQRVVRFALRLTGDFDPFHSPGQCCQDNFRLHTGNCLPDTALDAHTKPDMARGIACDFEAFRVGPSSRVAIGGPKKQ